MDFKDIIKNKTVMITGGTGSFGNAMAKRLLDNRVGEVIIYSRDEKKQFDMGNAFNNEKLKFVIGDVRDGEWLNLVMRGVNMVFHAAALKQVPNCEFFPIEAVKTNSLGTFNVIRAAIANNVDNFVLLSTDKAVHPINAMGMSKALAERTMVALAKDGKKQTVLCGTRYGNVMYTRGSVIPLFIEQIKRKKPLTVTNNNMTRFMMSLKDSMDLVLFALTSGQNGEIYVKKAPAATMGDLAQALTELFEYKKKIIEIGTRPGEKVHEMLISPEELVRASDEGKYYKITPRSPNKNYHDYYFGSGKIHDIPAEGYTSANTARLTVKEIKKMLFALPEIRKELGLFKK